jgi:sulfite reductase alpha subunit-like flavoprotein
MIEVSPGTIHPPPPEVPMILIGPGTGVAPFRSFLQERDSLTKQCEANIAPSTLFFGCRYRSKDFFFASEWNSMLQSHVLGGPAGGLVVAFSREAPNNKVYVTHKMKEHAKGIWEAISHGASIFVAGRADKMPNDVEQALLDIIVQEGQLDISEAKKYLRRMEATARYQMECWS